METVTLRGEDFKTIHNTLCELRSLVERMTHSIVKIDDVQSIITKFEYGLQDAYAQDSSAFDRKMDHYSEVQQQEGFRTIWSIFSVEDLYGEHPYKGADTIVYENHWGTSPIRVSFTGSRWADLYAAANAAICTSGDSHHIFIEQFTQAGRELVLQTGS
jgi:hypothetical protein